MGSNSSAPGQIISLPKGGGAQHGIGEKFSPDLFTGTGNFTIPISLPTGRNGFQPQLNLIYSTGNGNGLFGSGWSLSVPGITRKTAKGIPRYRDNDPATEKRDVFILSGAEDLVSVPSEAGQVKDATRYRPRTEGLFARIYHHDDDQDKNYWEVRSKDGLTSCYGTNPDDKPDYPPELQSEGDPAVIARPDDPTSVFAWKLTLTKDPFANRIEYLYESDRGQQDGHRWRQPILNQIRYADYGDAETRSFLVTVDFEYEDRPDPFSEYRSGFEIRTTRRCTAIQIETHANKDYKVRRYELGYSNESLNGVSLLVSVQVVGFDDSGNPTTELPPLEFGYTDFNPQDRTRRDFYPIQGADLPATSLANSSIELADLFGNGLPDILEMNGSVRYWRGLGNGRFDVPRPMQDAPAGFALADAGVQLIDANGDGRTDLLVTQPGLSGYFPLQFGAKWDRRSMRKYEVAPSFNFKDPEVHLLDLTGDGVTDVIRSSTRLECFFNDPETGWGETRRVERNAIESFPNINFSDPRVKWGDLSGDGLQDVILVYDGNVDYWPNLGYGDWGNCIHMINSPRFPFGYDPKRILIGDVDGDGLADLIYVDDRKIHLWINQSGNAWSEEIVIEGTPPVSDMDAVRLVDLLGSGIGGVLWTKDATQAMRGGHFFLDLTGGMKPYLLDEMNNNIGALTKVTYMPSTTFYLDDEKDAQTSWRTPLPFPVHVVARVEVIDELSQGKLTTEYKYHHGYWDGAEREFRGFGRVEQFDSEFFDFSDEPDPQYFSPPTLTKTWFHQGPIGEEFGNWAEQACSSEYWKGDPQMLEHTESVNAFLQTLGDRRVKRDALRTLRGSILRTELYALDGTDREASPYTVTEHAYGLHEEESPTEPLSDRLRIFFPHSIAQRNTQWERGDDPMTQFAFTGYLDENGEFDEFGRPRQQTQIACPRGWRTTSDTSNAYLSTCIRTNYAEPLDPQQRYIHDRVEKTTTFEITNKTETSEPTNNAARTVIEIRDLAADHPALQIIGQTLNFYDGSAYVGLPFGQVGDYGAVVSTESLVLTEDILENAYGSDRPPYLTVDGAVIWPADYPLEFQTKVRGRAGYTYHPAGGETAPGYFVPTERRRYDFHDGAASARGLVKATRNPLGNDTNVAHDEPYCLLPIKVTDPAGLTTKAEYDYRVLQPFRVTDPNGNFTEVHFSPAGLPLATWVKGKNGEGDQVRPSSKLEYDFLAFLKSKQADPSNLTPIFVRTIQQTRHDTDPDDLGETIETHEYSDGFGRLLQTRAQGEEVRFGNSVFGGEVLPADQSDSANTRNNVIGIENLDRDNPNVVVSGWQIYDNKGRVVEKYEPFFSEGWDYAQPAEAQRGQKATMFYDPRGQVIRTLNPDGSEQRVIYGVPGSTAAPDMEKIDIAEVEPTPWEAYTYDANDLSSLSQSPDGTSLASRASVTHYFTPASIEIDALGRAVKATERNGPNPISDWYITRSAYDIQGNLLTVTDALGRQALRHVYDLAKHALRIESIDAGVQRSVLDATGNVIEQRDSKDALILHAYDVLNRSTHLWARNGAGEASTLREKLNYGDGSDPAQPTAAREENRQSNRLGRLYQHYDEAGLLTFFSYDFKMNRLEKRRQLIADTAITDALAAGAALANRFVVDWNAPPGLDHNFQTSMRYDALNRLTSLQHPEDVGGARKEIIPHYNRAGALESVKLGEDTYVERIAYNAKGQRVLITYGNGIMTRYAYGSTTFRLVRMRTEKYLTPLPAPYTYQPNGALLQDFAYEHDLAGNIVAVTEQVAGCGVRNNPLGGPLISDDPVVAEILAAHPELKPLLSAGDALLRRFNYDPLYRLISATGREEKNIAIPRPWEDTAKSGFGGYNWGTLGTPSPESARDQTSLYTEQYDYDAAGNMLALKHSKGWTRRFGMSGFTPKEWKDKVSALLGGGSPEWGEEGNRLTNFGTDENQGQSHTYDNNGNLTKEYTNRHFAWDHADRLIAFADRATPASPASREAIYLYDASGQRIKKFVRWQTGEVETTIYIDTTFEHHSRSEPGQPIAENNTIHIMDNQSRVAMVRLGGAFPGDGAPDVLVKYHLGDHLGSSSVVLGGAIPTDNTFINREEFFPYGEASFGSFGRKRYRFTGKERDEETGLCYYGARYLLPCLGRWISCDPAGMIDGSNLYAHVRNNPIRLVDRTGLAGEAAATNTVGYEGQLGSYKSLEGVKINGSEPTIREHTIPGAQLEALTKNPLTGVGDYRNQGPEYRANTVYLNPAAKAAVKTTGDNARTIGIKELQQGALKGKGGGANLNEHLVLPSIEGAVNAKSTRGVAEKGAVSQAGELFDLQTLRESGAKVKAFQQQLLKLKVGAGLSVGSGALAIYSSSRSNNRAIKAIGIGGGTADMAGGVTTLVGVAKNNAALLRLGANLSRVAGGAGGVVSAYSLYQKAQTGNLAQGAGDAAGVVSGVATVVGASSVALVAGAGAAGYGIGTLINNQLSDETQMAIGGTINEIFEHGWQNVRSTYFR